MSVSSASAFGETNAKATAINDLLNLYKHFYKLVHLSIDNTYER